MIDQEPITKDLQILETRGLDHIDKLLRSVTLLYAKNFHPYQASSITLEEVSIADVRPCALYVLESGMATARTLREAMLPQGIDTLNLTEDKTQIVYNWREQTNCIVSPPIIEVSEDDENIPVITDGLHRFFLAKSMGESHVNSIVIRNTACPLPALPVEWSDVKLCQTVPTTSEKRRFRFKSSEELQQWPVLSQRNQDRFLQGLGNKTDLAQELSVRITELHSRTRLTF